MKTIGWSTAAGALAAVLVVGCFSEHREVTAPTALSDRCREVARQAGVPAGNVIVGMERLAFTPAQVTVQRGQTVTWVNCEPTFVQHTTTSDDDGGAKESWRSPNFGPPVTYSHTFTQTGTNPYYCEPHPFMRGTVLVN